MRFNQSGEPADLSEVIALHREALKLRTVSHPFRSMSLTNLAGALATQFSLSRERKVLDEAISLYRVAVVLRPAPHPDRSVSLNDLASTLGTRFNEFGQREDLGEAINALYEALDGLVSGHPSACRISTNLGLTLFLLYTDTHQLEYLDKAMAAYRDAVKCESAPACDRFRAAKSWAGHADSCHKSALEAYRAAIELLPRLAMLGLNLHSRHQALKSGSDGLARDAAACAVRSGQLEMAVELLEEGRGVFWSQALQLRTPITNLHDVAPELEKEVRRISLALEFSSLRDVSRHLSDTPQKVMSMEEEASHFLRLNNEWLATIEEVRKLRGFQDFLRPSRLSTLQDAAVNGPVVVLNTSISGNDALIITLSGVQHIPLPDLSFTDVNILVKLLQAATSSRGRAPLLPEADAAQIKGFFRQITVFPETLRILQPSIEARHVGRASDTRMQPEDIFRHVLAVLWVSMVKPVLHSLKLEVSWGPYKGSLSSGSNICPEI